MLVRKKLREKGVMNKVIALTETHVTYVHEAKKFPLTKEENVRLDYFLTLVFLKFVPAELIYVEYPVKIGTTTLRADIVVRSENEFPAFFLIAECKRPNLSQTEIQKAHEQAFSYERQLRAKFVVITDGRRHFCHETIFTTRGSTYKAVHDIPAVRTRYLLFWQIKKWWFRLRTKF